MRPLTLTGLMLATLGVLGFSIVAISIVINLVIGLENSEARSREQLIDLVRSVVSRIEANHRSGAADFQSNQLRNLARYRSIESAMVINPDDVIEHATSYVDVGKKLSDSTLSRFQPVVVSARRFQLEEILRDGDRLVGLSPITWRLLPGEFLPSQVGVLIIVFDIAEQVNLQRQAAIQSAIYSSLGVALLVALAALIFHRTIGRSVTQLVDVAANRQPGSGTQKLREFQQIQDALQEAQKELRLQLATLTENELRFRDIVENSTEWIFEAETSWRLIYSNNVIESVLGISASQVGEHNFQSFLAPEADNLQKFAELCECTEFEGVQLKLIDVDGRERLVMLSGNSRQQVVRVLARDVTEERHLENILLQSQKMDAVGQLAGATAHDFNNILSVILGTSEIMLLRMQSSDDHYKALCTIRDSALHASQLTSRLVTLARQEIGAPVSLEVNKLIKDSEELLRSAAGEQITVHFELDEENTLVEFDPGQLEQLLLNLTINARHALPEGGNIYISTKAQLGGLPKRSPSTPTVMLEFRDDGEGMSDKVAQRAFEPFFTTRASQGGSGLGLASVLKSVTAHDGHLQLESKPGIGTAFLMVFPQAHTMAEVSDQQTSELDGAGRCMLLVEDVDNLRTILADHFTICGFQVIEANSIQTAMKQYQNNNIDLVITDLQLPDGNGMNFVEAVRCADHTIFMSGYATPNSVAAITLETGRNYMRKPFQLQDLDVLVNLTLSQSVNPKKGMI